MLSHKSRKTQNCKAAATTGKIETSEHNISGGLLCLYEWARGQTAWNTQSFWCWNLLNYNTRLAVKLFWKPWTSETLCILMHYAKMKSIFNQTKTWQNDVYIVFMKTTTDWMNLLNICSKFRSSKQLGLDDNLIQIFTFLLFHLALCRKQYLYSLSKCLY